VSDSQRTASKRTASKRKNINRVGRPGGTNRPITLDSPEGIAMALIALLVASVAIPLAVTPVREAVFGWVSSVSDWAHDQRPAAVEDIPVKTEGPAKGYSRAQFGTGWESRDGCDVRDLVVRRDVVDGRVRGCDVLGGRVVDPYDGTTTPFYSRGFDVDHVVSLAEAWRSGAASWTKAQRTDYANDPDVLVLAKAGENRAKGDKDPGEWQPATAAGRCLYARKVVEIKYHYRLSMDAREAAAVQSDLAQC
jgi:hypothetical protein